MQYAVAPMDLEILKFFFYDVRCAILWLEWFTKMAVNGSEKVFCVLAFHYRVDVCRITNGAHTEHL
jgi:hypothetical protein